MLYKFHVRLPEVSLSSDFISGFCGETEDDHQQTLSLIREVGYNVGFLFAYSMRKVSFCGFVMYITTEKNVYQQLRIKSKMLFSRACLPRLAQKTHAYHRLQDDVPAEVKQRRLEECISVFREEAARVNAALISSTQLVLVEGVSTAHVTNTGLNMD